MLTNVCLLFDMTDARAQFLLMKNLENEQFLTLVQPINTRQNDLHSSGDSKHS